MKSFLNRPEHFFLALIAALSVYVVIFMYFQISSYQELVPIERFYNYSRVETPEEITLKPDQIEVPKDAGGEVRNIARDNNDSRKRSKENWSENVQSGVKDPVQSAKDFEKKLFEEAGGAKERERIQKEMEERKKNQTTTQTEKSTNNQPSNSGKSNQYAGDVMVDFSLTGRTAFENNNWHIRNPGYTCGHGSAGTVVVLVSVDKTGRVIGSSIDESRTTNATSCMREQALKYAGISKFNFSDKAPVRQEGYIRYRFVSQ
jgi:hypothetical protein